jgi:hypothetical protein
MHVSTHLYSRILSVGRNSTSSAAPHRFAAFIGILKSERSTLLGAPDERPEAHVFPATAMAFSGNTSRGAANAPLLIDLIDMHSPQNIHH